jgi:uncharacterized protein YegL
MTSFDFGKYGIDFSDIVVKPVLKDTASDTDNTLLFDNSTSMSWETFSKQFGRKVTRKFAVKANVIAYYQAASEIDTDGVDCFYFSNQLTEIENPTLEKVAQFLNTEPSGGTNLGPALKEVFDKYKKAKAAGLTKRYNYLAIVTDGEPANEQDVYDQIIEFTHTLDTATEYQIAFVQAGDDRGAMQFFDNVDNNLLTEEKAKEFVANASKSRFSFFGKKPDLNKLIKSRSGKFAKFDIVKSFDYTVVEKDANLAQTIADGMYGG